MKHRILLILFLFLVPAIPTASATMTIGIFQILDQYTTLSSVNCTTNDTCQVVNWSFYVKYKYTLAGTAYASDKGYVDGFVMNKTGLAVPGYDMWDTYTNVEHFYEEFDLEDTTGTFYHSFWANGSILVWNMTSICIRWEVLLVPTGTDKADAIGISTWDILWDPLYVTICPTTPDPEPCPDPSCPEIIWNQFLTWIEENAAYIWSAIVIIAGLFGYEIKKKGVKDKNEAINS